MMNLNAIRTITERAAITVTLKGFSALWFPILVIWGHSPAAPKVTIFTPVHRGAVFASAQWTTACLFLGLRACEWVVAIGTHPLFPVLSPPSGSHIADMRTVATIGVCLRYIKHCAALLAAFFSPLTRSGAGHAELAFVPRWCVPNLLTGIRAKDTTRRSNIVLAAIAACFIEFLHTFIISLMWLKDSYHALAERNCQRLSLETASPQLSMFDEHVTLVQEAVV